MNQTSFVEPMRRARFKRSKPAELAARYSVLTEWYAVNKPQVKTLRITPADARSIRENWKGHELECRQNGFNCTTEQGYTYRGFYLVEQK